MADLNLTVLTFCWISEIQRQFNKRVKYEVNKRFGLNYLADHQVRDLDVKDMQRIRSKSCFMNILKYVSKLDSCLNC